jgi:hypothetical protein
MPEEYKHHEVSTEERGWLGVAILAFAQLEDDTKDKFVEAYENGADFSMLQKTGQAIIKAVVNS